MKIILARHGETEDNRRLIIGGQRDTPLNENGVRQAKDLALKLKDAKIDVAYSSPLIRALRTAEEIMKLHDGVPLHVAGQLKERNAGEVEGRVCKTNDEAKEIGLGPIRFGESPEQFQDRIFQFTKHIIERYRDETVLFVSHGGVMMAILNALEKKPASEISKVVLPENGELKVLDFN